MSVSLCNFNERPSSYRECSFKGIGYCRDTDYDDICNEHMEKLFGLVRVRASYKLGDQSAKSEIVTAYKTNKKFKIPMFVNNNVTDSQAIIRYVDDIINTFNEYAPYRDNLINRFSCYLGLTLSSYAADCIRFTGDIDERTEIVINDKGAGNQDLETILAGTLLPLHRIILNYMKPSQTRIRVNPVNPLNDKFCILVANMTLTQENGECFLEMPQPQFTLMYEDRDNNQYTPIVIDAYKEISESSGSVTFRQAPRTHFSCG